MASDYSAIWQTDTTYYLNNTGNNPKKITNPEDGGKLFFQTSPTVNSTNFNNQAQPDSKAAKYNNVNSITVLANSAYKQQITVSIAYTNGDVEQINLDYAGFYEVKNANSTMLIYKINDENAGELNGWYLAFAPSEYTKTTFAVFDPTNLSALDNTKFPTDYNCFLKGVEIETISGKKNIEELKVNDQIITIKSGKKIIQNITSVHTQKIIVQHEDHFPIRVLKSAIADNVPYKDLLITSEHCLLIDEQFIPVRMLVNGSSIIKDTSYNSYDIYHVETEEHSIIIADGTLTESYLDTDVKVNDSLTVKGQKTWKDDAAAPLNTSLDFVKPIYENIKNRAKINNIIDNSVVEKELTTDYGLYLTTSNNNKILSTFQKDNKFIFHIPSSESQVILHSLSSRPSDIIGPYVDDRRYLGVLVGSITLLDKNDLHNITEHLTLSSLPGWYEQENSSCRWTNGQALLNLNVTKLNSNNTNVLVVEILGGGPYHITNQDNSQKNIA